MNVFGAIHEFVCLPIERNNARGSWEMADKHAIKIHHVITWTLSCRAESTWDAPGSEVGRSWVWWFGRNPQKTLLVKLYTSMIAKYKNNRKADCYKQERGPTFGWWERGQCWKKYQNEKRQTVRECFAETEPLPAFVRHAIQFTSLQRWIFYTRTWGQKVMLMTFHLRGLHIRFSGQCSRLAAPVLPQLQPVITSHFNSFLPR